MNTQTEISILDNGNLCLHVPLKIKYKNGRNVKSIKRRLNSQF